MRLIDADAFDKCLENAEAEAIHMRKYVFASAVNVIRGNLKAFPTIEPERPKGKWITYTKGSVVTAYKCSECGRTVRDDTGYDVAKDYPFCHCGADMRGEQE